MGLKLIYISKIISGELLCRYYYQVAHLVFVKLEELHIATARKPLIHQNQPFARYLHQKQPCMLWFMLVGL